jgi:hypothetical protein
MQKLQRVGAQFYPNNYRYILKLRLELRTDTGHVSYAKISDTHLEESVAADHEPYRCR